MRKLVPVVAMIVFAWWIFLGFGPIRNCWVKEQFIGDSLFAVDLYMPSGGGKCGWVMHGSDGVWTSVFYEKVGWPSHSFPAKEPALADLYKHCVPEASK